MSALEDDVDHEELVEQLVVAWKIPRREARRLVDVETVE